MPEYTPSQLKAIETKGKSLVVSAGAGSGKTTVLTERIIRGIIDGGDIDDIVVVTFTKAAAADMKEKLYTALSSAAAENIESRRLSEMSLKIASARISTISSFCYRFVRENFEQLGLSPRLRMADDGETKPLLAECLTEVEEEAFERDDGDIVLLADSFGGDKNMNRLDEMLLELYGKFRATPFWKDSYISAIENEKLKTADCRSGGFFATPAGAEIMDDTLRKLNTLRIRAEKLFEFVEAAATSEKHIVIIEKMYDDLTELCQRKYDGYSALKSAVTSFSAGRLYNVGMERDAVEHITHEKNFITARMNKLAESFAFTEEQIAEDCEKVIRINEAIKSILFALDEKYTAVKNRRGICDYSDVEHLTLKLLGKRTPGGIVRTGLCRRYAAGIRELYVDEYQDVNPLQDMIFSLLSKGNNAFFVGDVKQSVYRFRNASARIFGDRVKNAPDVDSEGDTGKIYLRENFRSSENVVNFVNAVFEKLYTPENTGYSYENEKLVFASGVKYPLPAIVTCITDAPSGKRDECEATVAAAQILSLVSRATRADGTPLKYGDFAVLLRSASGRSAAFERVFRKHGIPFAAENDNGFLEQPEIMLAVSLLTVVDDPTDEIALAASLRSPVFMFTAEELRLTRLFRPELSFYSAVSACANEYDRKTHHRRYTADKKITPPYISGLRRKTPRGKRPDINTLEKCSVFIRTVGHLSSLALEMPSHKLIWRMYTDTRLVETVSCFDHGDEKKNNLMTLYKLAVSYESGAYRGLGAFLEYLKNLGTSVEGTSGSNENCVRIMTFHRSKGLEFPICIVCGTGSEFNVKDLRMPYVVGADNFVYCDLRTAAGLCSYQPLIKLAAVASEKKEMLREELRCFYVALTRAKEQLYVTGCFNGDPDEVTRKDFFEQNSNMERMIYALNGNKSKCFNVDVMMADALPTPEYFRRAAEKRVAGEEVSWKDYDYPEATRTPAKVAVSELRLGLLEDDEYERTVSRSITLKAPDFAESGKPTPAEMGTASHMFMQFCSFENVETNGVYAEAMRLLSAGLIDEHTRKAIRYAEIERFFGSPLYAEMKTSPMLKREMRFTLIEDSVVLGGTGEENILVQGVIDCFFENPDGTYTVVDYKTDRVRENDGEEQLKTRHRTQIGYYCRAVEKMTGRRVSRAVLYSFALGRAVYL